MSFYEAFCGCEYQPNVCFVKEMIKLKKRHNEFHGKIYQLKTDYYGKLQEYRCEQYIQEDNVTLYKISSDSDIIIEFEECMLETFYKKYLKSFIVTILKSDFNNRDKDSINIKYKVSTYDFYLTTGNIYKNGSIITHRKSHPRLSADFKDVLNITSELIQFLNKLDQQNKETT